MDSTLYNNTFKKKKKNIPIVAIGASAGGQEAVTALLENIPAATSMAFVYIQHLDPNHESNLVPIISRATTMQVLEAEEGMALQEDHFYIIPPNKEMALIDGVLTLNKRPSSPYFNMPIDKFFISLSEKYKEVAIGIILSGAANDGTIGLKSIRLAGGLTFAQDETARFQSMPKSAIEEGAVDLVLSPKEIAEELLKIGKQKDVYFNALIQLDEDSFSAHDEDFLGILKLVYKSVGVDFRQYKPNTIKRRMIRRMMLHKLETLKDYSNYLKQHAIEVNLLYHDLLINVTTFFRDEAATDYLKKILLPGIIKTKSANDPIRIWIPACSTGQEVYSIAMVLMETLGYKAAITPIQIFATDLSEAAMNKARLGIYTKNDVIDVPAKRLQQFFLKTEGGYRIIKSIRDVCIFATHNIAKDPPFSRLDLISCCNLLIYLDNTLQKKVLATFHYSLLNNGYLILGKSETVGSSALFSSFDKKLKIYKKQKDPVAKALFEMNLQVPEHDRKETYGTAPTTKNTKAEDMEIEKIIDSLFLKRYTPASVVVNKDLDILQFRGSTGIYLEPTPGKASLNLLKMARSGLGFELRNVVHKAKKTGEPAKKEGLEIISNGKALSISVEAIPLKTETEEEFFLVVFEEKIAAANATEGTSPAKDKKVRQLEGELNTLREDMRSIVESQEAANEELQSANEEIVSSNEELQSINEELETSKEEIESSNEELITINQELQVRNEQLAEVQEYSEAVFSIMRESLIILDKGLRVKNANVAFYKTFHVAEEETEGRMLYELGNGQWDIPRLRHILEEVIPEQNILKDFEVVHNFPGIGEKIMILNARRIIQNLNRQQLILLAIEDVTEYRKSKK